MQTITAPIDRYVSGAVPITETGTYTGTTASPPGTYTGTGESFHAPGS